MTQFHTLVYVYLMELQNCEDINAQISRCKNAASGACAIFPPLAVLIFGLCTTVLLFGLVCKHKINTASAASTVFSHVQLAQLC